MKKLVIAILAVLVTGMTFVMLCVGTMHSELEEELNKSPWHRYGWCEHTSFVLDQHFYYGDGRNDELIVRTSIGSTIPEDNYAECVTWIVDD